MIVRNPLLAPVRRTAWFLGALLLVLASALAAALLPSGPPASRLTGSAFDPSTTAVALRVRTQKAADKVISIQRRSDEGAASGGGGSAALVALLPAALALPHVLLRCLLSILRRYDLPPASGFHLSTKAPRAPPFTFA